MTNTNTKNKTSCFACMECGHKFRTLKAAERASFGPHGCPKCGSADIDLANPNDAESSRCDRGLPARDGVTGSQVM